MLCSTGFLLAAFIGNPDDADETNRQLTRDETEAEIKKLWNDYAGQIIRSKAVQVGAIYARYSTKYQSSVIDQIRENLAFALRESIYVPLEHIFFDLAVSGRKKRRPGLQAVDSCLNSPHVQVLIVFTTNRLHRRANRALDHVERLVKECKKRVVFVMNQIDSQKDEKWKRFLQFLCLFDEFSAEMYVESIRASHIGKLINRMVFGTLPFGYQGVDIPGSSNRKGNPNRSIEIHESTAKIVQKVFDWFVKQALSINEIIRRLNDDPEVPSPPKSRSRRWTRLAVKTLLKNQRYRGEWSYGKKESVLLSEKDYIRQDERDEPLKTVQFEELRIISDEQYYAAQKRLAELDESANRGRKPNQASSDRLPKLLNGLYICPEHEQRLYVGGPKGEYMVCPVCQGMKAEDRSLFSQLNRKVALEGLCNKLSKLIQEDTQLVDQIIAHCQSAAESFQQPDADRVEKLRNRHQKLKRSIGMLMRQEPDSDAEEQELQSAIREKRVELSRVESELAQLESANERVIKIPSRDEVRCLLNNLSQTLLKVSDDGLPEEVDQLRELLRRLTGGRIELYQQGERKAQQGWLQGRFNAPLLSFFSSQAAGTQVSCTGTNMEVVVDFKAADSDKALMDDAWVLYNQGKLNKEIAALLECSRGNVTRLLKKAADLHGVEYEDGRKRRARLEDKQIETPQYKLIADEAVNLFDAGKSFLEIGRALNCSDTNAKKAIEFWHESRKLPVPTPGSRRKELQKRAQQLRDQDWSDAAIGRELGVSGTTVRNWLD